MVDPDLFARAARSEAASGVIWLCGRRGARVIDAPPHHIDQLGTSTFCNYLTLSGGRLMALRTRPRVRICFAPPVHSGGGVAQLESAFASRSR